MRAARLLQILLLLQNRGRLTSRQLAAELEVTPRTILRDVDAMTEAGLPVIVHQGNQGGIELGFNYRTRLTGLAQDEAAAMALILLQPLPALEELGMEDAARRARAKLIESFPDKVRQTVRETQDRIRFAPAPPVHADDPRIPALAKAITGTNVVTLRATAIDARIIHPLRLERSANGCTVIDGKGDCQPIPQSVWGDINISARTFTAG